MNDNTVEKPEGLSGFLPKDIEQVLNNEMGSKTLEFLTMWAGLTRKSLKANKEILFNCLTVDIEDGHILCRFCGEGIPNWKQENAREHKGECPMNMISDVLVDVKNMHREIKENLNQ